MVDVTPWADVVNVHHADFSVHRKDDTPAPNAARPATGGVGQRLAVGTVRIGGDLFETPEHAQPDALIESTQITLGPARDSDLIRRSYNSLLWTLPSLSTVNRGLRCRRIRLSIRDQHLTLEGTRTDPRA